MPLILSNDIINEFSLQRSVKNNMKYKKILIFMASLILIVLSIYLISFFKFDINLDFSLYHENHNFQEGEASLYKYYKKDYCFSENEKQMISNRIKMLDVFDNEIFNVSECGDLRISFDVKDYDAFGYIYLYSSTSFKDFKNWFLSSNHNYNANVYDTWISIIDDDGSIRFYENEDQSTFRIIYITTLPYVYKINEISSYSPFVTYFLEINQKNTGQV